MAADTTAPKLISISVDYPFRDIDLGETTTAVTAHLTDDLSGLFDGQLADGSGGSAPQIRFVSPSGQTVTGIFDVFHPRSGNQLNGTFRASITLSPFAEDGIWTAEYLFLADEAGNTITYFPDSTAALDALSFTVDNDNSDSTPPTLASISLSDTVIDIGAGEMTLIVTARLQDDLSRLFDGQFADGTGGSPPQIRFVSPSGQLVDGLFDILHPVSGDGLDGVFRATITIDDFAEAGTWTVQSVLINDEAGNTSNLDPGNFALLQNLSFEVVNDAADKAAPTLGSLQLGMPVLNPDGTTTFTVTAHFTDDQSGIFDGTFADGKGGSPPQIRFVSATGQIATGMFDILHPASGDRLDGVFQATVTLNAFAEAGTWKVAYLLLSDEAGNSRSLYPETSPQLTGATFCLGSASDDAIAGTPSEDAIYSFGGNDDIRGGNGDDTLLAGDGDDTVVGGEGDDQIVGGSGAGKDRYVGGNGDDTVIYSSASKKISVNLRKGKASGAEIGKDKLKSIENVVGGMGKDALKGDNANNVLAGQDRNDRLNGAGGKDTLDGGDGNDKLTGGSGKDLFVFRNELDKKHNVDTIKDFQSQDCVVLLSSVFSAIGSELERSEFEIGKRADDSNNYVIFMRGKKKSKLFYDSDGDGDGKKILFAKLKSDVELTHKDFKVLDDFVL